MTKSKSVPNKNTPYANLKPDFILDAVESVGFHCTGSLLALNSYENRVYQIGIEDSDPIVAKFYRPNRWSPATILEEHQFTQALCDSEIPVVTTLKDSQNATLHYFKEYNFALFPRWGGHALELDNLDHLERMGRFLGRIHAVSACQPFQYRVILTTQVFGHEPLDFLSTTDFIPIHLKETFLNHTREILNKVENLLKSVSSLKYIRLHGDLHAGNVLWDDAGPHILDFDDCMMGPAIQDIWMLLSGNEEQRNIQIDYILRGYSQFHDFNRGELRLIEGLRTLRLLHYAGWLARRWEDPTFPINFPWFDTAGYWEELLHDLREQNKLLDNLL